MLAPDDVFNVAGTLLTLLEDVAGSAGLRLPERRFVNAGEAVYDCEQVAVSVSQLTVGLPSAGGGTLVPCGPSGWSTTVRIAIVRCSSEKPQGPRGDAPPLTRDIIRDLAVTSTDASAIVKAVQAYADVTRDATLSIAVGTPSGGLIATVGDATLPLWPTSLPELQVSRYAFPL